MAGFALRHWTSILIAIALAVWAVFYLPDTPSYAIFELKQSIDARDGAGAAHYVDFQKVVRNAGYEMVDDPNSSSSGSLLGQLIGKGAVDLLSGPMAAMLQTWATQQVDNGARQLQMPAIAVVGAVVMLHRNGDAAFTRWQDNKGQVWEVRMARENGQWQVVEVKNVKQLLDKLRRQQEKQFNSAPAVPSSPDAVPPPSDGGGPVDTP
ncbi:MAG TPA: hypothetical protein VGG60_15830 [Candidatus Binataceae bacterium]|jgi:hypothetical protein